MNRDQKLIFENYRRIQEQQENETYIKIVTNAINKDKDIAPDIKKKIIDYYSQPVNADGLKAAIEAGQNETADNRADRAWDAADVPAQEPVPPLGDPQQGTGLAPATDLQGNTVNPYVEDEDVNEFLHGPGGVPNSQTSNYGNINDKRNAEANKNYIDYPGRKW